MESGENGARGPEPSPERRLSFLDGVLYGFEVGREYGFEEGAQAMRRALETVLRGRLNKEPEN